MILQSVDILAALLNPSMQLMFEKGTIVIDSIQMEDSANKIIKYLRENPEKKEKAIAKQQARIATTNMTILIILFFIILTLLSLNVN